MNACARFEEEGLLAVEAGGELDAHFDDCPDCDEARATTIERDYSERPSAIGEK